MFISDLKVIFLVDEGAGLPLLGVEINFIMSPGSILFAAVELTNRVESLLSITSSVTTELYSHSLLSTINSFKSLFRLDLVKDSNLRRNFDCFVTRIIRFVAIETVIGPIVAISIL